MSILTLSHVRKSFGDNPVIRDISLEVNQGDVVAILGPSGSGKTTLLRCAAYLTQADGGTLTLDIDERSALFSSPSIFLETKPRCEM